MGSSEGWAGLCYISLLTLGIWGTTHTLELGILWTTNPTHIHTRIGRISGEDTYFLCWLIKRKNLTHYYIHHQFLRKGQLELPKVGRSRLSFLPGVGQGAGILERTDEGNWNSTAKGCLWSPSLPWSPQGPSPQGLSEPTSNNPSWALILISGALMRIR